MPPRPKNKKSRAKDVDVHSKIVKPGEKVTKVTLKLRKTENNIKITQIAPKVKAANQSDTSNQDEPSVPISNPSEDKSVEIEPSVPVSNPSEDKSVEIEKLET
jgi:hypothetical protein